MATRRIALPNGNIEYRNEFGELHNPDGPAKIPVKGYPEFRQNGLLHSLNDNPSQTNTLYTDSGEPLLTSFAWHKGGKYHRETDKPAVLSDWGGNRGLSMEVYYKNGHPYAPKREYPKEKIAKELEHFKHIAMQYKQKEIR